MGGSKILSRKMTVVSYFVNDSVRILQWETADPKVFRFFKFLLTFLREDQLLGEIEFFVNLSQVSFEQLNEDLTNIFFALRSVCWVLRPILIIKANDLVRKSTGHMLLILIRETLFIARFTRVDWFHDRFEICVDNTGDFLIIRLWFFNSIFLSFGISILSYSLFEQ